MISFLKEIIAPCHNPIFCRDGKWAKYHVKLTNSERWQIRKAFIKSSFIGGCPADHMSGELEEIVCGLVPERYTLIKELDWEIEE